MFIAFLNTVDHSHMLTICSQLDSCPFMFTLWQLVCGVMTCSFEHVPGTPEHICSNGWIHPLFIVLLIRCHYKSKAELKCHIEPQEVQRTFLVFQQLPRSCLDVEYTLNVAYNLSPSIYGVFFLNLIISTVYLIKCSQKQEKGSLCYVICHLLIDMPLI